MIRQLLIAVGISMSGAACTKAPEAVASHSDSLAAHDPRGAVDALRSRLYRAIERGDADDVIPHLAPDALVFGLGPNETYNFRDVFIEALRRDLAAVRSGDLRLTIADSRPVIGVGADGTSAWFFDRPDVVRSTGGNNVTCAPRVTAHAVLVGGAWILDAVHVSLPVPDAQVYAGSALKRFTAPAELVNEQEDSTLQFRGLTKRILEDPALKVRMTSDRPEVALIGTDPSEVFVDGVSFKKKMEPRLSGIVPGSFSLKIEGNLRARRSPSGRTGWVAGNVVLRLFSGKRKQVLPAFRSLWIFAEEGEDLHLVSEHQSLGLRPEQQRWLPGSGSSSVGPPPPTPAPEVGEEIDVWGPETPEAPPIKPW
jgi:hypothetical protein